MFSIRTELLWLIPTVTIGSFYLHHVFQSELPPPKTVVGFVNAEEFVLAEGSDVAAGGYQKADYSPGEFVNDGFVYYPTSKRKAKLLLHLPLSAEGEYEVEFHFVENADFGIVGVYHDGRELVARVDLYAPQTKAAPPVRIPSVRLDPSKPLEIHVLHKNPKAVKPFYQIGLDGIAFRSANR